MNQGHVFNTNLRSFVRLTFRLGNFSLNCSFRSFFSSDGLAYAMTDTYKRKMTIPNQQSIPLNKVVQQKTSSLHQYATMYCMFCSLDSIACQVDFKESLSVLKLCAPVLIFISSSSALLGCPCCGLSIATCHIHYTVLNLYQFFS